MGKCFPVGCWLASQRILSSIFLNLGDSIVDRGSIVFYNEPCNKPVFPCHLLRRSNAHSDHSHKQLRHSNQSLWQRAGHKQALQTHRQHACTHHNNVPLDAFHDKSGIKKGLCSKTFYVGDYKLDYPRCSRSVLLPLPYKYSCKPRA